MEVTLNIPDTVVRKIKALSALEGGSAADVEKTIAGVIDEAISNKIQALVLGDIPIPVMSFPRENMAKVAAGTTTTVSPITHSAPSIASYTESDVTAGLSELDDEEEDYGDMEESYDAMVPKTGGLTADDIDNDMKIEGDNEAIGAEFHMPAGASQETSAEDLFSSSLNMPSPPPSTVRDPRIVRRQQKQRENAKSRRAKVSEVLGEPT